MFCYFLFVGEQLACYGIVLFGSFASRARTCDWVYCDLAV